MPDALVQMLNAIVQPVAAHYGVVVESLDHDQRFASNENRILPSASVYKLPLAVLALQAVEAGRFALADTLSIRDEDLSEPEPDGGVDVGDTTYATALEAMLSVSSNSAAHALLRVLGREDVNRAFAALGLPNTRVPLQSDDADDPSDTLDDPPSDVATTTAADTAHLLRLLASGQLLSTQSRALLYGWMRVRGEPRPVEDSLPDGPVVAAKAGNLDRASNVAALVFDGPHTLAISVFDTDVDPGDARLLIGQLARTTNDFYAAD